MRNVQRKFRQLILHDLAIKGFPWIFATWRHLWYKRKRRGKIIFWELFFCLLLSRHLVVARQGLHTRLVRSTNQTLNFLLSFFNHSLSGSFAKNRGHFHLNNCTYLLKTRSGINTNEFWGHFAFLFWREIFQALNEVDSTNGQTVFNCALQVIQPHWDVKYIAHFICSLCLMYSQSLSYQVWANHIFWHFHNSTSFDLGFKVFAVFEFSLLSRFCYFVLSARI